MTPPEWVGFDIETTGAEDLFALQPWRHDTGKARIRCYAVATGDSVQVRPTVRAPDLRELLQTWADKGTYVATWNAAFEIAWMCAYGLEDLVMNVRWVDGALLWKHLTNTPRYDTTGRAPHSYSLSTAVDTFKPAYAGYDDDVDFDGPLLGLMAYNALDSKLTREITMELYNQLEAEDQQRLRCAMIETHSLPFIGSANYAGLWVDREAVSTLGADLQMEEQRHLNVLSKHGATPDILASPVQLRQLLFGDWGLTPVKHTKTGASTDKETLINLAMTDSRAHNILQYREARGNYRKFVENLKAAPEYNENSRAHPLARAFGTYTGRMTYASKQGRGVGARQTGFALHQMKRESRYRKAIVPPAGYDMVELDAAGQEFRWMAELSGDPVMRSLCAPGQDPHSYMGAQISGRGYREVAEGHHSDPELKRIRQLGKVANLSMQYRTGVPTLMSMSLVQHGMPMDRRTANRVSQTYVRTYNMVPRYWERQVNHINKHLNVRTLAGRTVYVSRRVAVQQSWAVGSTAVNFPIQGTGGDQKYLALSVLRPLVDETEAVFAFDLHDGLYFFVPHAETDRFVNAALYLLQNLPFEKAWGVKVETPMPWDAAVGPSWGELEKVGD